jgi:hypothetical protein
MSPTVAPITSKYLGQWLRSRIARSFDRRGHTDGKLKRGAAIEQTDGGVLEDATEDTSEEAAVVVVGVAGGLLVTAVELEVVTAHVAVLASDAGIGGRLGALGTGEAEGGEAEDGEDLELHFG